MNWIYYERENPDGGITGFRMSDNFEGQVLRGHGWEPTDYLGHMLIRGENSLEQCNGIPAWALDVNGNPII